MKKRLAIYCGLSVLVYAGFFTYVYFCDGVTRANYLRIKTEMTRSEIMRLLGGPFGQPVHVWLNPAGGVIETWPGTEGTITLVYDAKYQIIWKEWDASKRRETLFEAFFFGRVRE